MANDLTLWGVGTSRTMRAHWMLLELGLDYHFHPIGSRTGETQTGEFIMLNPRHKIPVLKHGSFVLTESAAIIQYLSNTFQSPRIYMADDHQSRAALDEWCYFIISELDAGSLYVVRRHDGLKQLHGNLLVRFRPRSCGRWFTHDLLAFEPSDLIRAVAKICENRGAVRAEQRRHRANPCRSAIELRRRARQAHRAEFLALMLLQDRAFADLRFL